MLTIRMMGDFTISTDGKDTTNLVLKTKKGVALLEYLILNQGKEIPKQRLLRVLWSDGSHTNPENAMKTLISRLRKQLNDIQEDLGNCIVSTRGSYHWENRPGMRIDLLEIMRIYEELPREKDEEKRCSRYRQLIRLYVGDLFFTGEIEGGEEYQSALRRAYLNAIYEYIEILIKRKEHSQIVEVCKKALRIAPYDERLSMELTLAQAKSNDSNDALKAYQEKSHPEEEAKKQDSAKWDSYYEMLESNNSLQLQLDSMVTSLQEKRNIRGAFVCDFEEFGLHYRLLMPTLERLGCTMFLGLISLEAQYEGDASDFTKEEQQNALTNLLEILRENLRQGDVVTSFSTSVMMLLPTVNYTTGNMIMERIRYQFYEKNRGSLVPFRYRLREIRE